ncbi:hypothetical protein [Sphingobacterium nematocida]|uniref:hypothetical protein n=1 Tax=Sphingobacterium nematocida TaxID=1513896 RepID=UPI00158FA08F|nr:hypothetical protein [Sphingobacterium nematocida]
MNLAFGKSTWNQELFGEFSIAEVFFDTGAVVIVNRFVNAKFFRSDAIRWI